MSEETTKPPAPKRAVSPVDVIGSVGIALFSFGAGLAYLPAGFIVPGILLIAVAVAGARRE